MVSRENYLIQFTKFLQCLPLNLTKSKMKCMSGQISIFYCSFQEYLCIYQPLKEQRKNTRTSYIVSTQKFYILASFAIENPIDTCHPNVKNSIFLVLDSSLLPLYSYLPKSTQPLSVWQSTFQLQLCLQSHFYYHFVFLYSDQNINSPI